MHEPIEQKPWLQVAMKAGGAWLWQRRIESRAVQLKATEEEDMWLPSYLITVRNMCVDTLATKLQMSVR